MNTTLYPGIPFSPQAQLTNNIGAADTIIEVSDVSAFPPAPNLATIGTDEKGETILYTAKTETALSGCQRGVEGEARGWTAGELIGRNFTAKDHADLIAAATEAYGAAEAAQDAAATAGSVAATKQPKLTGQPGQVVGFGEDGAAVAVPGWSNQNLLINGDFRRPVNRNGKTEYTIAGYTIDRWHTVFDSSGTVSVGQSGVTISNTGSGNLFFIQAIEKSVSGIHTLSVLTADGSFYSSTLSPNQSEYHNENKLYFELKSNEVAIGVIGVWSLCIVAAKLEPGPIQTLAHQVADGNWVLNDPSDYDLQYALCSLYSPITGEWVGSQHSNPNLLDNWYFADPVNQRGQTEYTAAGYTIDRWKNESTNGTVTLNNGSVTFSWNRANSSEFAAFAQILDYKELVGKVCTWSLLAKGSGFISLAANDAARLAVILTDEPTLYSITAPLATLSWLQNRSHYRIVADDLTSLTGEIEIFAVKLEPGPVQTLARQDAAGNWVLNDPPPNKASELAKCQRYQVVLNASLNDTLHSIFIGTGTLDVLGGDGKISGQGVINLPVPLRGRPAIPQGIAFYAVNANASIEIADMWIDQNLLRVNYTVDGSTPMDNKIGMLCCTNTIIDANL